MFQEPLNAPFLNGLFSSGFLRRIAIVSPRYRLSPMCSLGTRIAAFRCHTSRSVKSPPSRHFQDRNLTTNNEKWGKDTGLCFARFVFSTFRGPLASHDSNPYPNRSRIARDNAAKFGMYALYILSADDLGDFSGIL